MTALDRKQQAARARSFAGIIRQAMRDYWKARSMIAVAYQERHWETLGYESWDDYCAGEFGPERLGLPAEHRDATLELFRAAGMSVRAISSATGVPRSTVADQVSGSGHLADAATQVKGVDGKTYAPKISGPTGAADHTPPADPDETPARQGLAPLRLPESEVIPDGEPDQQGGVVPPVEGQAGATSPAEPPAGPSAVAVHSDRPGPDDVCPRCGAPVTHAQGSAA